MGHALSLLCKHGWTEECLSHLQLYRPKATGHMKLCVPETHLGHLDAAGYSHTNWELPKQCFLPTRADVITHKTLTHTHTQSQTCSKWMNAYVQIVSVYFWGHSSKTSCLHCTFCDLSVLKRHWSFPEIPFWYLFLIQTQNINLNLHEWNFSDSLRASGLIVAYLLLLGSRLQNSPVIGLETSGGTQLFNSLSRGYAQGLISMSSSFKIACLNMNG